VVWKLRLRTSGLPEVVAGGASLRNIATGRRWRRPGCQRRCLPVWLMGSSKTELEETGPESPLPQDGNPSYLCGSSLLVGDTGNFSPRYIFLPKKIKIILQFPFRFVPIGTFKRVYLLLPGNFGRK
jgi:hypothetical protein